MSEQPPRAEPAIPTQPSLRRIARGRGVVAVPPASRDGARWVLTGPIAIAMLVLGVSAGRSCSRMFGDPQEPASAAAASVELAPSTSIEPVAPTSSPSASTKPSAPEEPTYAVVSVGKSQLMHCQDPPGGELTPSRCGESGLDPLVVPAIEALSGCAAAAGITGKLSLTIELPTVEGKKETRKVIAGRASQVSKGARREDRAIAPLVECVRKSIAAIVLPETAKTHGRWVIAYPVTMTAPVAPSTPAAPSGSVPSERPITGSSLVQVDTAIVRDAPSTTGALIGRLSRGTKVTTIGISGHWYHIKYGENDASEGWIFRTNIGR